MVFCQFDFMFKGVFKMVIFILLVIKFLGERVIGECVKVGMLEWLLFKQWFREIGLVFCLGLSFFGCFICYVLQFFELVFRVIWLVFWFCLYCIWLYIVSIVLMYCLIFCVLVFCINLYIRLGLSMFVFFLLSINFCLVLGNVLSNVRIFLGMFFNGLIGIRFGVVEFIFE